MRGRAALVVALLQGAFLAGCFGGAVEDERSPAVGTPCEHPWPCGDGSEWPSHLVTPAHPRQPAVFPDGFVPPEAEVVERTPTSVTFRWIIPTIDAVDVSLGVVALDRFVSFDVPVPDGLYHAWAIGLELPADPDRRSYDLELYDDKGNSLCFTDHDLSSGGVVLEPLGDARVGCETDPFPPLAAPATYKIGFEHEHDRAGDTVGVLLTFLVVEPFLRFDRLPVEPIRVPMRDGVELDGALWRSELPAGVRAPIVLQSTPYPGQCPFQELFAECWPVVHDASFLGRMGFGELLDAGYAIAIVNVRGTGGSGGCYDAWGAVEQEDHADLVAWLAAQPWSNGRVGMTGISYHGTTPWEAAIVDSPALKAIVVGGIISDVYLGGFTPQGAANDGAPYFHAGTTAGNSLTPPRGSNGASLPQYLAVAGERACPGTERQLVAHTEGAFTDARDAEWFAKRRLIDRFADVTAAALVLHGVEDDNFHRYQEDVIWDALPNAPKAMVLGQWDHTTALEPFLENYDGPGSWYEMSKAWFDFFLKGLGEPPAMLGVVSYQDSAGDWRASGAWPPADARLEVLYLTEGALATAPGQGAAFRATRSPQFLEQGRAGNPDLCGGMRADHSAEDPRWVSYVSEPLAADVVIAGNPWGLLALTSDAPGGVVSLDLYALAPDGSCEEALSAGAVDLQFHAGNMEAQDFPVGTSAPVRVDLFSAASRVPAGHRLVVVLSGGGEDHKQGQHRYAPLIGVAGESHLVLPLVLGSLGGAAPTMEYPARPFAP